MESELENRLHSAIKFLICQSNIFKTLLKYLQHAEIDFALWDDCVQNSAQQMIYAYAGYLEISTAGNWDALVELIDGKYVVTYGISVNKKIMAGKMARMKLKGTPLARSMISSSLRFFRNFLTILYSDTSSCFEKRILLIQSTKSQTGLSFRMSFLCLYLI